MTWNDDFESIRQDILFPVIRGIQQCDTELVFNATSNSIIESPFNLINAANEAYKAIARTYMVNDVLDRHKLAACLCGAIMSVKPIIRSDNKELYNVNESLAVLSALKMMRPFIITKYFKNHPEMSKHKNQVLKIFRMSFPNDIICDKKAYALNLCAALKRIFSDFEATKESFVNDKYDIWAYSKIFYHIDVYNFYKIGEYCTN